MAKTVNMHEAKTHLSRLVQEIQNGPEREIIITVSGKPSARIVPVEPRAKRVLGFDAGLVEIGPGFDEADEEIAKLFNGD